MIETGVSMGVATIKRCSIENTSTLNAESSSFTSASLQRPSARSTAKTHHEEMSRRGKFPEKHTMPRGE